MAHAHACLNDPRVDATLADSWNRTPVSHAAYAGHLRVIEWLITSGRDLGDLNKKGLRDGLETTPMETARRNKRMEVVALLERFMIDGRLAMRFV